MNSLTYSQETAMIVGLVIGCAISIAAVSVAVWRNRRRATDFLSDPDDWGRQ
ncbi:hypothetical protein [Aminobacter sp. BE322]|uniref:hypothetical protein n=1 Tax=unclassified Aminobacter TaxID=2644704 RepID=UPI003D1F90DE